MKLFVFVSALVAIAAAKPSGIAAPLVYTTGGASIFAPLAIAAPISSQFHAQDELGQYSYGYSNGLSAKSEARSVDGVTVGGYKYVDAEGKLQSVEYSSDGVHGFRVAATNLPVAPAVPEVPALPQPLPVQDTPEVAEAKAKHLAALEQAKVRSSFEVVAPVAAISTVTLSSPVISAAPVLAVKSIAPAAVTEISTAAPAEEAVAAKSAEIPAIEVKSEVAPAAAVKSVEVPAAAAVAVKSFIAPTFSVSGAPLVAAPLAYGYSINSVPTFGYSSAIVAQPAITSYVTPFGAQFLTTSVAGAAAVPAERWTAAKEVKETSE